MKFYKKLNLVFLSFLFCLPMFSCSSFTLSPKAGKQEFAEVLFNAQMVTPLLNGEKLYLEVLDEVTGISLNPQRFELTSSNGKIFSIRLPFGIGSVVRYRYIKSGHNTTIEKDALGNQVYYRLFHVKDASSVSDVIVNWENTSYSGLAGELSGYIFDKKKETPLSEIMVVFNGMRTFTSQNGYFQFPNVPLGEYHLTAIHPNSKYEVFQQNAVIEENSITPASFGMIPAKNVDVTFVVTVPEYTNQKAEVRLIGNTLDLGNTFFENIGGSSVIASTAPILKARSDGKYEVSLQLPAGSDLRYKYTLGDGLVNAEHGTDRNFLTRQLIVPTQNTTIYDSVSTWYSKGSEPVNFVISAPENTPDQEFLSIQFNPFTWLTPIKMWKTGANQWTYTLYSPFEYLNRAQFRFCRNGQCGIADDEITSGKDAAGYQLNHSGDQSTTINYKIENWFGLEPTAYSLQPNSFQSPNNLFIKGFQIENHFDPNWFSAFDVGLIDIGVTGANFLFFSPMWRVSPFKDNLIEFSPERSIFSHDILKMKEKVIEAGLSFGLYPKVDTGSSNDSYWVDSTQSYNWWHEWFDQYERFILNYTDFAESHGIKTLVIGGKNVSPAFPNGKLPDGGNSNTPYDILDRWLELIKKIRSRFTGQIGFAIPYQSNFDNSLQFLSATDFIYMELDSALTNNNSPSAVEISDGFNLLLDESIYKLYANYQKPVILNLEYFSIDGTASNCSNYNVPCANLKSGQIDGAEQADVYQGVLSVIISKSWIYGIVSAGFNPAVPVEDSSSSVYGKPAMQVLAYYFSNLK